MRDQAPLSFTQIIWGLESMIKDGKNVDLQYNRNQEIMKELIRIVVMNYRHKRNITFYADKMHLSSAYLSSIIKKTTGKALKEIISSFILNDAKAKLKSTDLTIQEIAYSLNFPDISFFGKY